MTYEKMLFHEDKYINGELIFKAGETYDIPVETGSVTRWLKRGATIVERALEAPVENKPAEEKAPEVAPEEEEVVNEVPKKENKKAKKSSK
jgi:hypothetical protein